MTDMAAWKIDKLDELTKLQNSISFLDFDRILKTGDSMVEVLKNGNKIAFLGNGGSAAESMHLAAEFVSKCSNEHRPLNAISLNESQSAITAIANDYGFEFVFERLVEAELRKGDILVSLSTSGKSINVLKAINKAVSLGVKVYLWTGLNKLELEGVDVWNCTLENTPRIQELHLIWGHLLAEYVELHFE
jgi:D-sedoheptulose 7-phosphate isomerase